MSRQEEDKTSETKKAIDTLSALERDDAPSEYLPSSAPTVQLEGGNPQLRDEVITLSDDYESEQRLYTDHNNIYSGIFYPSSATLGTEGYLPVTLSRQGSIHTPHSPIAGQHTTNPAYFDPVLDEKVDTPGKMSLGHAKTSPQVRKSSNWGKRLYVVCWLFCCILIIVVLSLVLRYLFKNDNTVTIGGATGENTASPTVSPTTNSPSVSPTAPLPTISPTKSPSFSPVAPTASPSRSPTRHPTQSPSLSPTTQPTTTLTSMETICSGSSGSIRTSVCLTETQWVKCEKDGGVIMTSKTNEEYLRTCEDGDVCPCDPFSRLSISDPCVLASDAPDSEETCTND